MQQNAWEFKIRVEMSTRARWALLFLFWIKIYTLYGIQRGTRYFSSTVQSIILLLCFIMKSTGGDGGRSTHLLPV